MESPPKPQKKLPCKSRTDMCSLEEVLGFEESESIVTAFEKQMQRASAMCPPQPQRRRIRKFGRDQSLTHGNNNANRSLFGRDSCNQRSGFMVEDDEDSTPEKRIRLSPLDDEDESDWPVPSDLRSSFNTSKMMRRNSCNSTQSLFSSPERVHEDESNPDIYGYGCPSIFGNTNANDNVDDVNRPRRMARRCSQLGRSHTLPAAVSSFSVSRVEPRPFGGSRRQHRSLSLIGSVPQPTGYPQRSHSISSWTLSTNDTTIEATEKWLMENSDPNYGANPSALDAVEKEHSRERKKIRARRHSIQGHIAPLTETKPAVSSYISSDPALNWLISKTSESPPSKENLSDTEATTVCLSTSVKDSSPSNRSISSSRKRGMCCGSPSSDLDDWSSGGFPTSLQSTGSLSSRRALTRIFSPQPGAPLPIAPPLSTRQFSAPDLYEDDIVPEIGCSQVRSHSNIATVKDDESDESDDESNSSPDVSMDSDSMFNPGTDTFMDMQNMKTETVFNNMSSYEDLKFMIKALRKESTSLGGTSFGVTNTWNVAPPFAWPSHRRNGFFLWARKHLGFTVRSAGMAVNYLQISRSRGTELLETLEAALIEHKQNDVKQNKNPQITQNGFIFPASNETSMNIMFSAASISAPSPMQSVIKTKPLDESANELASDLLSLTVKENQNTKRASNKLTRIVTYDPKIPESMPNQNKNRNSFESVQDTNNFMLHLHGDSPVTGKPQKLSLDSVHTIVSMTRSVECAGTPSLGPQGPIQNLEIFATPLLNDTKGWGSHPVPGKDWGASEQCESSVREELTARLDATNHLDGHNSLSVVTTGKMARRASNNLAFDLEANANPELLMPIENTLYTNTPKEKSRLLKKRMSAFNKRRRMSLWASATQNPNSLAPGRKSNFRGKSLCPVDETFRSAADLHRPIDFNDGLFPSLEKIAITEELFPSPSEAVGANENIVSNVLSFLNESELLSKISAVCTTWSDMATTAHANLMLASIVPDEDEENQSPEEIARYKAVAQSMERSWDSLHKQFPWACYLAEGGAKRVYKVYNKAVEAEEAVSVMDTHEIESRQIVANELAVSALLSSLSRRGICPNFVMTRGIFTCPYKPPGSHWGNADKKRPKGMQFNKNKTYRAPREPKTDPEPGRYQYIRMELVNEGDAEELMKRQSDAVLDKEVAQSVLFQVAFALHAAADRFSVKHYDIKLLNVFMQRIDDAKNVVLRYGLGSHMFALRMPSDQAFFAKLADFGTANINSESNGQPVTIAQFTTLENTPPDFLILGDEARQGHGHDNFGLGLCMLHLFTGNAPYEEILEDVRCPTNFKKRLKLIWENEEVDGYNVVRSLIHDGVVKDEAGHIIEGDPDETLYDTLYRYLVLFGVPSFHYQQKKCPKVWKAIVDSFDVLQKKNMPGGRPVRKRQGSDIVQYNRDCKKYSIRTGSNKSIARARRALESIDGGMDLLFRLCCFDPSTRASAIEVLNSAFMNNLREAPGVTSESYGEDSSVYDYTAFSTNLNRS